MAASTEGVFTSPSSSTESPNTTMEHSPLRYFRGEDLPVLWALVVYVGPFLMMLGTIGNAATIVVLSRALRLKNRTTSVYPVTIASLCILAVNLRLLDHMLSMHGLDIRSLNYSTCKVVTSVIYGVTEFHLWVNVNLAIERVLALYSRSRGIFENDSHTICLFLVTTGLAVVSINVTYLPTYEQNVESGEWACDAGTTYYAHADGWFWVQYCMLWLLPSVLLLLCGILVAARLAYSYNRKKHSEVITYVSKLKLCGVTLSMLIAGGLILLSTLAQVILQPLMYFCVLNRGTVDQCMVYRNTILYVDFFMNFNYVINVVILVICVAPFRQTAMDLCYKSHQEIEEKPPDSQVTHVKSTSHR
ncbi:hypothetical protein CAPTEDRAFT_194042 [Capitella teleta]|uniref:G-protein coupled receptors family 1 profile domain-containing protein n=1 Tax=Capitella teleta TaxID=283909 RepID=R7UW74_CAPTE|nr:hypothetical protein CAPTEDRAFT_194042 [Capitella teleta]|eukprot:ELU10574.1 hypothetical protein CAPTEDRAFT_194042 [Capitella teleta]